MDGNQVFKVKKSRLQRLQRLLVSTFDPRALAHLFKIINYYNYTHVSELRLATLGRNVSIAPNVSLANAQNIVIGDNGRIGANVSLWAGPGKARIVLGKDALIAPNVMLTAANYRFDDGSPVNDQAMDEADIIVGDDVWIGAGVMILAGVTVGDRAIIGAGAVVRSAVPRNAIVAGDPARVVGHRRDPSGGDVHVIASTAVADADVLSVIRMAMPHLVGPDLALPVRQLGIDSFDLITLRMAVESASAVTIPDREWAGIVALEDIAKLPSLTSGAAAPAPQHPGDDATVPTAPPQPPPRKSKTGKALRQYTLNMPQMALSGLGESWLFKELGDLHWGMITDFLQSPSSAIADDLGDRLYATFTRIQLTVDPGLRGFVENAPFTISSGLNRFGASFFFGTHQLESPGATCTARTMSTFAKYGERGENTSLIKGSPTITRPDALPSLPELPAFGTEYRARRNAQAATPIFECDYDIMPSHDINGVGLLYFAAYPSIFDLCLERSEGKGFLLTHTTVSKDMFYFANSEPTETLVFRLHARSEDGDLVRHTASLSRKSDGKRMGEVDSVKRRVGRAIT